MAQTFREILNLQDIREFLGQIQEAQDQMTTESAFITVMGVAGTVIGIFNPAIGTYLSIRSIVGAVKTTLVANQLEKYEDIFSLYKSLMERGRYDLIELELVMQYYDEPEFKGWLPTKDPVVIRAHGNSGWEIA